MEAVVCHSVNHSIYPSVHTSLLVNVHCRPISHWSDSRPVASSTPSTLHLHQACSQLSCYCLCHGASAALDLQDQPFHVLQQRSKMGRAHAKPWIWAWEVAELVSLPGSSALAGPREISSNAGLAHSMPQPARAGRVSFPVLLSLRV